MHTNRNLQRQIGKLLDDNIQLQQENEALRKEAEELEKELEGLINERRGHGEDVPYQEEVQQGHSREGGAEGQG